MLRIYNQELGSIKVTGICLSNKVFSSPIYFAFGVLCFLTVHLGGKHELTLEA